MVAPPQLVAGRYRLQREISAGAKLSLFTALDEQTDRPSLVVTAKSTEPDDRFRRDARSAGALRHPFIAQVIEHGDHEGTPFVVVDTAEGSPLHDLLAIDHLEEHRALLICDRILQALDHAHETSLVHGALDARVVLLAPQDRVVVTGFGFALPADRHADLRAVGNLLQEMLPPHPDPSVEAIVSGATERPPRFDTAAQMRAAVQDASVRLAPASEEEQSRDGNPPTTVWPIPGARYDPATLGRRVIATMIAISVLAAAAFLWRAITRANELKEQRQETPASGSPTPTSLLRNLSVVASVTDTEPTGLRGTLTRPVRAVAADAREGVGTGAQLRSQAAPGIPDAAPVGLPKGFHHETDATERMS